eukprot:366350-Chlamydomonas_euryale.AAC.14
MSCVTRHTAHIGRWHIQEVAEARKDAKCADKANGASAQPSVHRRHVCAAAHGHLRGREGNGMGKRGRKADVRAGLCRRSRPSA